MGVIIFVIIFGGGIGRGAEISGFGVNEGVCEGTMRTSELHFGIEIKGVLKTHSSLKWIWSVGIFE